MPRGNKHKYFYNSPLIAQSPCIAQWCIAFIVCGVPLLLWALNLAAFHPGRGKVGEKNITTYNSWMTSMPPWQVVWFDKVNFKIASFSTSQRVSVMCRKLTSLNSKFIFYLLWMGVPMWPVWVVLAHPGPSLATRLFQSVFRQDGEPLVGPDALELELVC